MPETVPVPEELFAILARLTALRPLRRGSVSERRVKCSKPGCRCRDDDRYRHGPYFSLTRAVGGRTRSRYLTAAQAEQARRQIEAGRAFRADVEALWKASEQWADAELEDPRAAAEEAVKKRASNRCSKPRSPRGSTR